MRKGKCGGLNFAVHSHVKLQYYLRKHSGKKLRKYTSRSKVICLRFVTIRSNSCSEVNAEAETKQCLMCLYNVCFSLHAPFL